MVCASMGRLFTAWIKEWDKGLSGIMWLRDDGTVGVTPSWNYLTSPRLIWKLVKETNKQTKKNLGREAN